MKKIVLLISIYLTWFSVYPQKTISSGRSAIGYSSDSVEIKIDLKHPDSWSIAGVPCGQPDLFPEASSLNNLSKRSNCASLSWYIIDPLFYDTNEHLVPPNIANDPNALSSFYVNQVWDSQLFPEHSGSEGYCPVNLAVLNLSYYPCEKGPYNFDVLPSQYSAGIDSTGHLMNPKSRWGGILRRIENVLPDLKNETNTSSNRKVDFRNLEFWLMDPFVEDTSNAGGDLFFNMGNISEDVLNNGILDVETRDDGLDNEDDSGEIMKYNFYLDSIAGTFGLNSTAYTKAFQDPSSDDYHFFRGTDYDQQGLGILDRYRKFNGSEGNSTQSSSEVYPTIATTYPNTEDINGDDSLDTEESYCQYTIHLTRDDLSVGKNHIDERRTVTTKFPNGITASVNWYHFTIPLHVADTIIGNPDHARSNNSMRLFLRGFSSAVHLRFATMDLTYMAKRTFRDFISVYPNPTTGPLTIDFDNRNPGRMTLYDQLGRMVYDQVLHLVDEQKVHLDVSALESGIYFLKLFTDEETVTKKIVIE